MSLAEILEFSLRSAFNIPINFVYAIIASLLAYAVVFIARWSISKKWNGGGITALVTAAFIGFLTFIYLGLEGADSYIEVQKVKVTGQLREDALWRNEALSRAWIQLKVDDKQKGLESIEDGGLSIRLSSAADAQIYAEEAAAALEDYLRLMPYTPPTVEFESKQDIAAQIMQQNQEFQSMTEPEILEQDNRLANQILDMQIETVTIASKDGVKSVSDGTKRLLVLIGVLFVLVTSSFVGFSAWKSLTNIN
jgi:hypothetical protein